MSISNAVPDSARSAVVGYNITKGDYAISSPNLPQRVAILSEINTDKQTGASFAPFSATSLSVVSDKMGVGSPAYMATRILRPMTGGGLLGIPIIIYPVVTAGGATATVSTITITGTATSAQKHSLVIAGRSNVDGQEFSIAIASGDTPTVIAGKYIAAISAVYGSIVTATNILGVVTLTSKWKGISSIFVTKIDENGDDAGVSYAITTVAGTLTGNVVDALAKFENDWNTIVINPYGADATVLNSLELFNGRPDPDSPTGRYQGIVFKPFISLFSKSTAIPLTDVIVNGRANECTNAYCPAPNIDLLPVEVAANVALQVANIGQNSPNIDVNDKPYNDAEINSTGIGSLHDWEYRDECVKAGLSTVDYVGGDVVIKDLVTTYNPTSEVTPQFKYVRNLILDWNIRYAYKLLEQTNVVNHTLVPNGVIVSVGNTVTPGQWKGILYKMFDDLADRGLIADPAFSKASLTVQISSTNPDRFDTFFKYKRTGIARICSTTAEAGFYYGA